jgi:hypothetical protein
VVPFEQLDRRRQRPDDRVGGPGVGDLDLVPPDLGLGSAVGGSARHLGEELAAEAHAEDRHAPVERVAEVLLLGTEPWMPVVLVDVHRAPEDHQGVRALAGRRAVAGHPGLEIAEHARPGVQLVDYGQDPHSGVT